MWGKATISIKTAVVVLAAAWQGAALAAAPSPAASEDVRQATVHFGDLRIDKPAGAAALYQRLRNAAERVCGDPNSPNSHFPSASRRACVRDALERAVTTLDQPALTAYYRQHSANPGALGARFSRIAAGVAEE